MTDAAPRALSSAELTELRTAFVKATLDPAKEQLAALDAQISAAHRSEVAAAQQAAFAALLPAGKDRSVVDGHDVVVLVNNSKEQGRGPESVTHAGVVAAHRIHQTLANVGEKGMTVAAHFWGGRATGKADLESKFGANGYNTNAASNAHDFLPAAKAILNQSTPDVATGRKTNYIIVSDGKVNDDVAAAASILSAAQTLNPKATLDFVVVSKAEGKTAIEKLAESLGRGVNVTKVASAAEVSGAVVKALQNRLVAQVGPPLTQVPPTVKQKPAV